MGNVVTRVLAPIFLGLLVSGAAMAANPHNPNLPRTVILVLDSAPEDFELKFLDPGLEVRHINHSIFFYTRPQTFQMLEHGFISLDKRLFESINPSGHAGRQALLFWESNTGLHSDDDWPSSTPRVLAVFDFQPTISPVPEANAGVMMVMGLPLLAFLIWRRRRSGAEAKRG